MILYKYRAFLRKIDRKLIKEFLQNLLDSDKLIIWHNLKYDLHVIYNFLEKSWNNDKENNNITQSSLF